MAHIDRIPVPFPGKLYRSPMPFSGMDIHNAWDAYQAANVQVVVMLTSRDECLRVTGFDLPAHYRSAGLQVVDLPVPDFGVIAEESLRSGVDQAIAALQDGKNVAVHCHAGRGRTGMFLACLLRAAESIDGDEAIRRVRAVIPGAIETPQQEQVVREFSPAKRGPHADR